MKYKYRVSFDETWHMLEGEYSSTYEASRAVAQAAAQKYHDEEGPLEVELRVVEN